MPPRNDPDPLLANKRDEMQEEQVEGTAQVMLEKTDSGCKSSLFVSKTLGFVG
jgi:hypothetical protein